MSCAQERSDQLAMPRIFWNNWHNYGTRQAKHGTVCRMLLRRFATSVAVHCDMAPSTIDSSVWVAAFLTDEANHKRAYSFLTTVIKDSSSIIIPVTITIEVAMALARRSEGALADTVLEFMLALPSVQFVEITYPRMIDIIQATSSLKVRGMDAVVIAVAREYDSRLVTLDKELEQRAKGFVQVVTI